MVAKGLQKILHSRSQNVQEVYLYPILPFLYLCGDRLLVPLTEALCEIVDKTMFLIVPYL